MENPVAVGKSKNDAQNVSTTSMPFSIRSLPALPVREHNGLYVVSCSYVASFLFSREK
jgi:hypothetical protein